MDALIAGSRGDLFNSSELRIYKTIEHSSVYGMVLAGDARKLQKCFADYMKENSAEISAHVASKSSVIKVNELKYHIVSYYIISYRIVSYRIISYHIISYHIISYHIISYHIISYHIIS